MECLHVTEYYSIMKVHLGVKHLLPAKSQEPWPLLDWECRIRVYFGNLDAKRDWGHAKDYVEAMWRMLQRDTAEDFVIATGITTTVREFIRLAFEEIGITIQFHGSGIDETGIVADCSNEEFMLPIGKTIVAVDPKYFRPTEVDILVGDSSKARRKLGWKPEYTLEMLVSEMVQSDVRSCKLHGSFEYSIIEAF